jgi:hypothetical protein
MHSLKYVIGRHWLRAHTTLVLFLAIIAAIAISLVMR